MKKKSLTVLCVLFGLMMINSGLNKFFNYMPMPEMSEEMKQIMSSLMTVKWILPLVAIVEIIGGVLVSIPKTRALGALVILPVVTGIVVHHFTLDIAGAGIGLILLLINIWVIIENREKYKQLLE